METKPVFQGDQHGFYLYEAVANELPLSPGAFNIPYGAYEDKPPLAPDGMVARRDGNGWQVVADHRRDMLYVVETGQQYSIGSPVEVGGQTLMYDGGGAVPAWLTDDAPTLAEPVETQ